MRVEINESGEVVSQHLPQVDQSLLLKIGTNGRVKAIEKMPTPVNEYGIPDADAFIAELSATLDSRYVPPFEANNHHLVYPRSLYHAEGQDSIPYQFRETPSLKLRIPVQVHKYAHWVIEPAKMPSMDTMTQVVKEQRQIDQLFSIGRGVIGAYKWLDSMIEEGQQTYHAAERYIENNEVQARFYDYLAQCEEPQIGLMPNIQELAQMDFRRAVRHLGGLSAAKALDLRRRTLEDIGRNGL